MIILDDVFYFKYNSKKAVLDLQILLQFKI